MDLIYNLPDFPVMYDPQTGKYNINGTHFKNDRYQAIAKARNLQVIHDRRAAAKAKRSEA